MSDVDPNKIVKFVRPDDPNEVAKTTLGTFERLWEPKGFVLVDDPREENAQAVAPPVAPEAPVVKPKTEPKE